MSDTYHYEDGAIHHDHKKVLHIDNINGNDVRKLISAFFKDDAEEAVIVGEANRLTEENSSGVGNQLLTNDIFNDELFNTNERLVALRDTIVLGVTGKDCIDLASGHEWYWLYAALYDAGVFETRKNRDNVVTDAGFVRQMAKWLFNIVGAIDEERVRQICKSMSAERGKWTMNGQPLSLADLEANKRRLRAMKENKINRIIRVAYDRLYLPLMKLKEDMKATR